MRLKQLESALCNVPHVEFDAPNIQLEQYPTSAHLTAQIISMAYHQYQDIGPNRTVIDLGCGTGMLSIGCALVDTDHTIGVDCDTSALEQASENVNAMELSERISFVHAKVMLRNNNSASSGENQSSASSRPSNNRNSRGGRGRSRPSNQRNATSKSTTITKRNETSDATSSNDKRADDVTLSSSDYQSPSYDGNSNDDRTQFPLLDHCVDTVITNPPFGTKGDMAGIDIEFVLLACQLATRAVYSFHKTTTREYVLRTIRTHGGSSNRVRSVSVIAEMKFNIQNTYQFHQQKSVDVAVDLIRVDLISITDPEGNITPK